MWLKHSCHSLKKIAIDLTPIMAMGVNGGAKLFVLELIKHLAKLAPEIQFILLTNAQTHEELQGLERQNVRRLLVLGQGPTYNGSEPKRRLGLGPTLKRLKTLIANRIDPFMIRQLKQRLRPNTFLSKHNIDLLFCPMTTPSYYQRGVPMVCTLYDLQYKTYPDFFTPQDRLNRERSFNNACKFANQLVTISNYTRQSVLNCYPSQAAKLTTIYIRMAQRLHTDAHSSILQDLNLQPKNYLIYPANYWKHKNHEMLLTAFAMAVHQGLDPTIKLVCTGASIDRQNFLKQAVLAMNLEERILFTGYLNDEDLGALIHQARGLIYPSLYEGFGLPILEAMANQIPVACSNTTALPEIAGDAAILFNPRIPQEIAHAMLCLLKPSTNIEAGLIRAKHFADPSQMAREYLTIFQEATHES